MGFKFKFHADRLVLSVLSALAFSTFATPALPQEAQTGALIAPKAWQFVQMSPDERTALREQANALPQEQRKAFYSVLKAEVATLPVWIYEALSNELVARMFCRTGTYEGPNSPPRRYAAWDYVKLKPHQRYHFRYRARLLTGGAKADYDRHFFEEMAKLPAWLVTELENEAKLYDAMLGLDPCQPGGISVIVMP